MIRMKEKTSSFSFCLPDESLTRPKEFDEVISTSLEGIKTRFARFVRKQIVFRLVADMKTAATKNAPGGIASGRAEVQFRNCEAYSSSSESSWNLLMMSFMTFGGTVS